MTLPEYWRSEILAKYDARPALIARREKPGAHGGPVSTNTGVTSHLAWDFEEFGAHVDALARGLIGMGVQKGDRVGVIMGNNSAYAMLQWACASIGAILVTINPAYRPDELVNALQLVKVQHLFVVPHIQSSHYVRMLAEKFPEICSMRPGEIELEGLPSLQNLVVVDNAQTSRAELDGLGIGSTIDWREIPIWREGSREAKIQQSLEEELGSNEVIMLQYTSGTTGLPKAVSLTHRNLLNNGIQIGRCMRLTHEDLLCNVPPLFHCFGLVAGNLAAWTHGAGIVYASETFDPSSIVDAVTEEKCTALHGVPTHFLGVLSEVEKRKKSGALLDFSRLRTGICAGSSIPIDLMRTLVSHLNLKELTIAYGMTETSPVSFQSTPDDPLLKRVETVGKVYPHVKAKIVDKEGNTVPVDAPGELMVSGYLLQKGYWENEAQTKAATTMDENGTVWMYTGDEAMMDEDGYVRIVGRVKDLIIRGGENLFPAQIENALTAHHSIREAAAIAVPDSKYGEVVGVWIVREPNEVPLSRKEVRRLVSENTRPQNAPAWVWFIDEDGTPSELPKTASGKVQKHILREWSKDLSAKKIGEVKL